MKSWIQPQNCNCSTLLMFTVLSLMTSTKDAIIMDPLEQFLLSGLNMTECLVDTHQSLGTTKADLFMILQLSYSLLPTKGSTI